MHACLQAAIWAWTHAHRRRCSTCRTRRSTWRSSSDGCSSCATAPSARPRRGSAPMASPAPSPSSSGATFSPVPTPTVNTPGGWRSLQPSWHMHHTTLLILCLPLERIAVPRYSKRKCWGVRRRTNSRGTSRCFSSRMQDCFAHSPLQAERDLVDLCSFYPQPP